MKVLEGANTGLSPADAHERRVMHANRVPAGFRLSCRARVHGPLVVTVAYW